MMAGSLLRLGLAVLVATSASALRITPDSSCSSVCGDSTTTNASDIVCSDYDYYALSTGATFMSCIECLQTSNATRDSDGDVSWFLYNLRYASAVCLFDFPSHNSSTNTTSACDMDHACKPLQGAIESGNLDPTNETEYGYCQADDDSFYGTSIDDCVSCLQSSPVTYTANFLLALEAGCKQEPQPGTLLSITGSLFSTTAISITSPSNATSSSSSNSSSSSSSSPKLSVTTIIAIAVTLGTLFLAATGLFTLYCLRQRRYAREDAHLLNSPYSPHRGPQYGGYLYYGKEPYASSGAPTTSIGSTPAGGGGYVLQPAAPPPLYTVDYNTNADHNNHNNKPDDFDSNAEYYDRLEGRSRGRPLQAHPISLGGARADHDAATRPPEGTPAAALPTHPAYIPRTLTPGGGLGTRPSRAASVSGSASSERQSQPQPQPQLQPQPQQKIKKPSYAMEVYLEGRGDEPIERAPSRNVNVELGGSAITGTSSTSAIASLILPPVPKIRLPGRKPSRLQAEEAAPPGQNMGISGPLAFPDRQFSARPGEDRIVEQTVERGGRYGNIIEVPIGSGKSYLCG